MDYDRFRRPPFPVSDYGNRGYGAPCCGMQPYQDMPYGWHGMPYDRAMPGMNQGVPYHVAHPYPIFAQEDDDERDFEKLQSLMPTAARMIQPMIEDECDRMEYDGSMMFDEYPDKIMMEQLVDQIYQRVQNAQSPETEGQDESESIFATACRGCQNPPFGDRLSDLITVMLYEEMHRRRCRHRRCKRWW